MHALLVEGLKYSATNSHISALTSILQVPGVEQIGEHNLVSRFTKGIFNLQPSLPRYSKIWDIHKVLLYLIGLGRNEDLTLRQLTLKTATLLSILVGRTLITLHKLETSKMDISDVRGR